MFNRNERGLSEFPGSVSQLGQIGVLIFLPATTKTVVRKMQSAKLYQRYATRCLQEARATFDSRWKAFLIEMAQAWQRLADQAKVMGAAHTSSSAPDPGD
jgi:hypothetical protein